MSCVMDTNKKLVNALAVLVLDAKVRAFLEEHDPKALLQAIEALTVAGFRFPQPETT